MKLNISKKAYLTKSKDDYKSVVFDEIDVDVNSLKEYIKEGRKFCHIFKCNGSSLKITEKTIDNFKYATMIFIDVDDSKYSIKDSFELLTIKPTLCFTSYSNMNESGKYRYRYVYMFNKPISNIEQYKAIYQILVSNIENDLNVKMKDNCMKSVAQLSNGNPNAEFFESGIIYDIESFDIEHKQSVEVKNDESKEFDTPFLTDYFNLSYSVFLEKYREIYPFFETTPLNIPSDDIPYILLPKDYIEIKRYWIIDTIEKENGNILKTSIVKKIKDGQSRRRKLFINGILRRFMLKDITFDYMLVMLIYELYYYIDNRQDKISKKDLFSICENVFNANLDEYRTLVKKNKKEFIVNLNFCLKYNVSPNTAKNISKKMIKFNKIGEFYDCSKSIEENLKTLKENGIKVSDKTLRRFKKENGLTRNYNKSVIQNVYHNQPNIIESERPINDNNEENKKENGIMENKEEDLKPIDTIEESVVVDNNETTIVQPKPKKLSLEEKMKICREKISQINTREEAIPFIEKYASWLFEKGVEDEKVQKEIEFCLCSVDRK